MTVNRAMTRMDEFPVPSIGSRMKSMIKLDFYRLFHTPLFYIMLVIAAMIPAMLLTTTGGDATRMDATGAVNSHAVQASSPSIEFTNVWQLVESTGGSAGGANPMDFGGYANINMLFIFAGLLMAIFVAHDYSSGFVKNIFTVHARKIDYVISKSAIGIFSGAGMIITYVIGAVISGMITGKSFDVNRGGLIMCLISKALLMGVFCSLFLSIAVFFRSKLWMTIVFTFLLGMMLYPAASIATLSSTGVTLLIALLAGAIGTAAIGAASTYILNKRDLT